MAVLEERLTRKREIAGRRGTAGAERDDGRPRERAIVIGAGLGGLSAAIHLQRDGWNVTILEKNARPGGRMNLITDGGFRFDTGPTLLMMPEVLDRLFESCGRQFRDYVNLKRIDPAYSVYFADGSHLEMRASIGDLTEAVRKISPADAVRLPAFVDAMRRKYTNARYNFIERPFSSVAHMMRPSTMAGMVRSLPLESVYSFVSKYMQDERLRQAFTFQTLYLGISPHDCPAIYALLPYIEMEFGVWYPEGGMYRVTEAMVKLFRELGGKINCCESVEKVVVENGQVNGVETEDGDFYPAQVVVSNRDLPSTYRDLVHSECRPRSTDAGFSKRQYGCSAYLLYLGVEDLQSSWGHHAVALSENYGEVLHQIMHRKELPTDPAMYVCIPSRTDPTLAPPGHDVVYVLTIVPHQGGPVDWPAELPLFRERVLDKLERIGMPGLREKIVVERSFAPPDFAAAYGCYHGSAFGLSPTFLQSAYWRPQSRCKDVRGLYHAGASTHPGGGIPMVITSGRLAAEQIALDYRRIKR